MAVSFLYDLDSNAGGTILAPLGSTQPALQINQNTPDYPALGIYSTASGAPIKVTTINSSVDFDSVGASTVPAVDIRSGATVYPALTIGKTVNSGITQAALKFLGTSVASGAIMEFAGGFISVASIIFSTGIADFAIPVVVGAGKVRYIPLVQGADIVGGAAF